MTLPQTCVARAWDMRRKPVLVCPSMNTLMWEHPATGEHLATLQRWGYHVEDPVVKLLACKEYGMGAMAPVEVIVEKVQSLLDGEDSLSAE